MNNSVPKKGYRFNIHTRNPQETAALENLEQVFSTSSYSVLERLTNFPLYVPRQTVTNFLIKYEIFKRILNVHGSIVECGVCFGGGLMTFAQVSAILEPTNYQRKIIGFDSFKGFPKLTARDKNNSSSNAVRGGLKVDSYNEILRCASIYDQNRSVGHIPKIELVRGDAIKTIPDYVKNNPHLVISLLYLDFDIYAPTRAALKAFFPRMPKGAIIAFDELNVKNWPGETIAVLEEVGIRNLRIERLPFGSTISFACLDAS